MLPERARLVPRVLTDPTALKCWVPVEHSEEMTASECLLLTTSYKATSIEQFSFDGNLERSVGPDRDWSMCSQSVMWFLSQ